MDEQDEEAPGAADSDARLAGAFRAAAADAPPPGFGAGDVVAASRRVTRRRRSALAGAALAVLAVAGVGLTAGLTSGSAPQQKTVSAAGGAPVAASDAAAPEAARAASPDPAAGSGAGPRSDARSDVAPAPGQPGSVAAAAGAGPPLGPGTGECADRQDPAVRALVEQVLPEVVGAPEAAVTTECRPGGERGVALEVRDGAAAGLLSVTYLPPGVAAEAAGVSDATGGAWAAPTASGGLVVLVTRAEHVGDPPPFGSRLGEVAAYLAPRL